MEAHGNGDSRCSWDYLDERNKNAYFTTFGEPETFVSCGNIPSLHGVIEGIS